MKQLQIVHGKKLTSKDQKTEQQESVVENKREDHGRNIALTRNVYRLLNSDTFYVESETVKDQYYFVRYNFDVFEYCSCLDNSIRGIKCKHLYSCEHSIRLGTLKDIDKLPAEAKRYPTIVTKSYRDDNYDF